MNLLFIINYNSFNQCCKLIRESCFEDLAIGQLIIFSNGVDLTLEERSILIDISVQRHLKLSFVHYENNGYGAAINQCIQIYIEGDAVFNYIFFSNADLILRKGESDYNYVGHDVVGFPLYEHDKFVISKINIYTPFIPFRIRKLFSTDVVLGKSHLAHGCFFGLNSSFLRNSSVRFSEEYFLYWEETRYFYDLNKLGVYSFISDAVAVVHDGEKSVMSDDSRYYLFRNGLHFYKYCVGSTALMLLWFFLNTLFATYTVLKSLSFDSVSWYVQAMRDFMRSKCGKRYS